MPLAQFLALRPVKRYFLVSVSVGRPQHTLIIRRIPVMFNPARYFCRRRQPVRHIAATNVAPAPDVILPLALVA